MNENESKNLPTLVDSDIVSTNSTSRRGFLSAGKLTTVALALSIATMAGSCKKSDTKKSTDADITTSADTGTTDADPLTGDAIPNNDSD